MSLPRRSVSRLELTEVGVGGAPWGNLYRALPDEVVAEAVAVAWAGGVRHFDTAPHYGLGLSERRLGAALRGLPRTEYVLSTKVGRILEPRTPQPGELDDEGFVVPATARRRWDFSREGVLRSVEESLDRLGLDRLDVVYLHDPERHWAQALDEGLPALLELRDSGVVGAVGAGMNVTGPLRELVEGHPVDLVMCAGRHTLLEHSSELLDAAHRAGVGVVLAGVFNSGLLALPNPGPDATYDYGPAPASRLSRARVIAEVCARWGTDLPTAAVAFALRHPAVVSVVLGVADAAEVAVAIERHARGVPAGLWGELSERGLVPASRPVLEGTS